MKIDGVNYNWGVPQPMWSDSSRSIAYAPIGSWVPSFNLGWGNNFKFGNLTLYMLFSGTIGGNMYDGSYEWLQNNLQTKAVSMANVPDSLKKPYLYFVNLAGGGEASGLTAINGTTTMDNSAFVASGSFVKLAEMSLSYDFAHDAVSHRFGADHVTLRLSVGSTSCASTTDIRGSTRRGSTRYPDQVRIKYDQLRYPLARRFYGEPIGVLLMTYREAANVMTTRTISRTLVTACLMVCGCQNLEVTNPNAVTLATTPSVPQKPPKPPPGHRSSICGP